MGGGRQEGGEEQGDVELVHVWWQFPKGSESYNFGGNMLVRFSSIKTDSITMFGDVAVQLIRMLGASGAVPGAITAEDIPKAVSRLRIALQAHPAIPEQPVATARNTDDTAREPPVALATRAVPFIDLLTRAAAAKAAVMWEQA
jgi:hypothetical protein